MGWTLLMNSTTAVVCLFLGAWLTRKQGQYSFTMQKRSDVFFNFYMEMSRAIGKVRRECDEFRKNGYSEDWEFRIQRMILYILCDAEDCAYATSMYISNANREKFLRCFSDVCHAIEKIEIENTYDVFGVRRRSDEINHIKIKSEALEKLKDILRDELWINPWPEKSCWSELQYVSWIKMKFRQMAQRGAQK